jgi:hypothetical protein
MAFRQSERAPRRRIGRRLPWIVALVALIGGPLVASAQAPGGTPPGGQPPAAAPPTAAAAQPAAPTAGAFPGAPSPGTPAFGTPVLPGAAGQPAAGGPVPFGAATPAAASRGPQLDQAARMMGDMEQVRSRIQRELQDARRKRDVVKALCLDDKLNQIDVAIRSAEERRQSLEAATTSGDRELANHEFTILGVLHQRAQAINSEANMCIGQETGFVGESSVVMEVDPQLPAEDTAEFPPFPLVIQPPNCASCFR